MTFSPWDLPDDGVDLLRDLETDALRDLAAALDALTAVDAAVTAGHPILMHGWGQPEDALADLREEVAARLAFKPTRWWA